MKHITLSIIFSFLFSLMQSQNIANTQWRTYNSGMSDTVSIDITVDSIFQYIHPDTMLAISLYTQNTDTITLADVGGTFACILTDTGTYKITIVGDTMTIDYVNDPCFTRNLVYNGAILWRVGLPIGIENLEKELTFKLYPNPANGFVSIETVEKGRIIILNSLGQVIVRKEVLNHKSNITFHLSSGIYTVKYQTQKQISTQKLIVR